MFDFQFTKNKDTVDVNQLWDVTIIGGGPAGLNAALYASRKGLSVLMISKDIGGQLHNTNKVDNYLGFVEIEGKVLSASLYEHVKNQEVKFLTDRLVTEIEKTGKGFSITTDRYENIPTKTILITTGGSPRKLGVPGEKEFAGKGVSYCTICDAPFYKDKDVVVVGGGNGAMDSVLDLIPWAKSITLIHRSRFRADQYLIDKVTSIPNLKIHLDTVIEQMDGRDKLESITIYNKVSQTKEVLKVDGVFISIGVIPNTSFLKGLLKLNEYGEIIVDDVGRTNVLGIYAAGDVTNEPYKQIIIAASEGAKAALDIHRYLSFDYKEKQA
jgi:alkyl hydroperoxide reductase subunit F